MNPGLTILFIMDTVSKQQFELDGLPLCALIEDVFGVVDNTALLYSNEQDLFVPLRNCLLFYGILVTWSPVFDYIRQTLLVHVLNLHAMH
jgi:hypothetical protein